MERLKYFMQCYFNQSFGFDELDERIDDFKQESITIQNELINEIKLIVEKKIIPAFLDLCRDIVI